MGTTTMTAYDSSDPSGIPKTAGAVFNYTDGKYAWKVSDHFPKSVLSRGITVIGDEASFKVASIIDVEDGCVAATELQAIYRGTAETSRDRQVQHRLRLH
jgi:hypothetical protein